MEIFFIILDLFGEVLINVGFEYLAEVGGHKVKKARKKRNGQKMPEASNEAAVDLRPAEESGEVFFAVIGYMFLGLLLGGLSLIVFPKSFIQDPDMRLVYLFVAPIISGLAMAMMGKVRDRRGEERIKLDNFVFGFLFALAMTGIRYVFAR